MDEDTRIFTVKHMFAIDGKFVTRANAQTVLIDYPSDDPRLVKLVAAGHLTISEG